MHSKSIKRFAVAFIFIAAVSAANSPSVSAQGQDVYLPRVGSGEMTVPQEQDSANDSAERGIEVQEPELDQETTVSIDLDATGPVSADSQYQDGDGPWAQPAESSINSAATNAFDTTDWSVRDNLGVGTDSPVHRIEVNDNVNWVNRLLIRNNHDGSNVSSDVYLTTGSAKGLMIQKFGSGFSKFRWSRIPLADYARIRTDTGVKGLIQTTGAGPMIFGTGDRERLRLHANGGVTVRNAGSNYAIKIEDPIDDGLAILNPGDDGLYVDNATGDGVYIIEPGNNGVSVHDPINGDGVYVENGNIRVRGGSFIDDGTSLSVPDYVFEEEYPLMSLDELQAFIETEKHLPNVPSEDEIHAEGLDLSAFHMRLLEKVEELTLYTLQQQEIIDAQQALNETQAETITLQQARIDALMERLSALEAKQ